MGRGPEPLCSTRVAARAVDAVGTNQTNRLPLVRTQTSSCCYAAYCRGRNHQAHPVRAAFRHAKPKLMTFLWFEWCYDRWRAAIEYVRSLPVWHKMLSWYHTVRAWALRGRNS